MKAFWVAWIRFRCSAANRSSPNFPALSHWKLILLRPCQKAIPNTPHGEQMPGMSRVILNVPSQPHNKIIDCPGVCVLVQSPDLFQNLFARDYLAIVLHEMPQQFRLHHREPDRAVVRAQLQFAKVDRSARKREGPEIPAAVGLTFTRTVCRLPLHPLAPTQQSLQPGQQNRKIERLGQVIVRSRCKAFENVLGTPSCGQHQYRDVIARGAQLGDDLEPIFAGKHDVQHTDVKILFFPQQAIRCAFPLPDDLGRISFSLEIEAESLRQVRLVFHHQYPNHACSPGDGATLGNSMITVVPCPSPALSANAVPPCFFAIDLTMNNPSPVPLMCASARFPTR